MLLKWSPEEDEVMADILLPFIILLVVGRYIAMFAAALFVIVVIAMVYLIFFDE